jgi:hypothetical protein
LHETPLTNRTERPVQNKKAPRDNLGLSPALFLAKNARHCGMGG